MPVCFGVASTATINGKVVPAMQAGRDPIATAAALKESGGELGGDEPWVETSCRAVASRSLEKAQEYIAAGSLGPIEKAYGSYEALLEDDEIDVVYCPLPTTLRNAFVRRALEAGKHIYAEKPLGGSVAEVKSLLDLAEEKGLQFMDGTMWHHSIRTREIERRVFQEKEIGDVTRVIASFTFLAPDDEWLHGGNGRTDRTREPMGCFGDQGWYPVGAIMWAFQYNLPEKVQMLHVEKNRVDTIVAGCGMLWFPGGGTAFFDFGCTAAHRSQWEIVGTAGRVVVDDQVGGQGRSGNFSAYEEPYVGSSSFVIGDASGKDETVTVPACDHVIEKVQAMARIVQSGKTEADWPNRTLVCHTVMTALFDSAEKGGEPVFL